MALELSYSFKGASIPACYVRIAKICINNTSVGEKSLEIDVHFYATESERNTNAIDPLQKKYYVFPYSEESSLTAAYALIKTLDEFLIAQDT